MGYSDSRLSRRGGAGSRGFLFLFLIISLLFHYGYASAADRGRSGEKHSVQLKLEVSDKNPYVGEPVFITWSVISDTPDLSYIKGGNLETLRYVKLPDETIMRQNVLGRRHVEKIVDRSGNVSYEVEVGKVMTVFKYPGRVECAVSDASVGVVERRPAEHPFWGRYMEEYEVTVSMKGVSDQINVKKLPKEGDSSFSGAVGDFKAEIIPEETGYLKKGDSGFFILRISGNGWIPDTAMPELEALSTGDVRLKAMQENRDFYIRNGKPFSVLDLEIEYTITGEGEMIIPELRFRYFSPESGSYETTSTTPHSLKADMPEERRKPKPVMSI